MSPGAGELEREARRILPRLAEAGACLRPGSSKPEYGLWRKGRKRAAARVEPHFVSHWQSKGYLEPGAGEDEGPCLVLTAEGRAAATRFGQSDPFANQHRIPAQRRISDGSPGGALYPVNDAESPLGWLASRRGADGKALLGRREVDAGERLRADFTAAQMTPRVTSDWSGPTSRNARRAAPKVADVRAGVIAAKRRFDQAVCAVGPGLSDVLIEVCCHLAGLEQAEKALGWPKRSGKLVLRLALERLADHYAAHGRVSHPGRARVWHAGNAKT